MSIDHYHNPPAWSLAIMDQKSPDGHGHPPISDVPAARCHDPERIRSVLGISALIESTDRPLRSLTSEEITQVQNKTSAGDLSDGLSTERPHFLTRIEPPGLVQPSAKQLGDIRPVFSLGRPAPPYQQHQQQLKEQHEPDASQLASLTETPTHPSLNTAKTTQDRSPSRPSFEPSIAAVQSTVSDRNAGRDALQPVSIGQNASAPAMVAKPLNWEHDRTAHQHVISENDEPSNQIQPSRECSGESSLSSQHDDRRDSLLTSPLTHPNGLSMFPNLSTPEQEQMAQEALTQAEVSIVADNEAETAYGSDGGYESDGFSSGSTSAESSVRDYMYENGRRYHRFREGHYNFPNDDVEQEREDMKHAMVKLLCSQKLHFAPIGNNPQEILDIGTGTGIWAIEMGDQFPSAHVLGIDLSPIQPDWLPPNVRFMVDDAESPWLFPRNHFDYIHSRHTVMAIKDWDRLYRRAFEHLKPGAWMEMQEIHHRPLSASADGTVPVEHPVARFWTLVTEGLGALGVNLDISSGGILASKMQEAGFTNVTERIFHVPLGTWPKNKVLKTVGLYWRTILLDGLQAIALGPLTRGLHWNREEVELLLMEVRRAYHDNSALMFMPLHIVYAQKPTTVY